MNQKEAFNSTVKNHHLNLLVSFDCRDDLVHLRKHLRSEDVERRVVKRDSPILGRAPGQTYLSSPCCCVILIFHGCCLLIISRLPREAPVTIAVFAVFAICKPPYLYDDFSLPWGNVDRLGCAAVRWLGPRENRCRAACAPWSTGSNRS